MELRAALDAFIATIEEPRPYSVSYDNSTGPDDGGYWEWWTVAGIKFDTEASAKAFLEVLNAVS